MATDEKANEREITTEERVKARMAQIKAKEDAQIRAEAEKAVEAELAAELEAERRRIEDEANTKARVEASIQRSKRLKVFATGVAQWLIDNDSDNPQSVPGSVVESLRAKAGF